MVSRSSAFIPTCPFLLHALRGRSKKDDPYGRIIHNYSHKIDGISLNDCVLDNSTEYISFKDRVRLLDPIKWYIKLDQKDGYRQLAVHQCFSPYIGGGNSPC